MSSVISEKLAGDGLSTGPYRAPRGIAISCKVCVAKIKSAFQINEIQGRRVTYYMDENRLVRSFGEPHPIRDAFAGAIQDQDLVLEEKRLRNEGTDPAGTEQPSQDGDEMDERTARLRIRES